MLREVAPPALPNEATYDASSGSVLEANDLPCLIARYCTPLHLFEFQHVQLTDFPGYPKESPPVQVGTGVQEPGSGSRREGPVSLGNGVTLRKSGEMEIEAVRCRVSCCNVAVTTTLPSLGGRPKRFKAATTGKATKKWQSWRCPFSRRHHETYPKRQPLPIPMWNTKEESTLGPAKRSIIEPIP